MCVHMQVRASVCMPVGGCVTCTLAVIHSQRAVAFPLGLGKKVTGSTFRRHDDDT